MLDLIGENNLVALIGAFGGILLGLASRLGRFCTLGAIEDYLYGGSDVRLRMWGVAIGTAIAGTFGLMAAGMLTAPETYYLSIRWMPLASIVGGLMFGYGMALSGNCGYGAIARLGGGDLRSFVIVLVMGVSAYVVLNGPLAPLRNALFYQNPITTHVEPGIAHYLASVIHLPATTIGIVIGLVLLAVSAASRDLWAKPKHPFWAFVVGLAVISGWAGTMRGCSSRPSSCWTPKTRCSRAGRRQA